MSEEQVDLQRFKVYCVYLRQSLTNLVDEVQPADPIFYRDTTLSNSGIGRRIRTLIDSLQRRNAEFGLFMLRRHLDCPADNHGAGTHNKYVMDRIGNKIIEYGDEAYIWHPALGSHMDERCICPCSPGATETTHPVLYDALIDKRFDPALPEELVTVFSWVLVALRQTTRKSPRSAIQINLMSAVNHLNDLILPMPVQTFIDAWYPSRPDRT
jgi:hypothetical protein